MHDFGKGHSVTRVLTQFAPNDGWRCGKKFPPIKRDMVGEYPNRPTTGFLANFLTHPSAAGLSRRRVVPLQDDVSTDSLETLAQCGASAERPRAALHPQRAIQRDWRHPRARRWARPGRASERIQCAAVAGKRIRTAFARNSM